ncbi:hypothetical protein D3C71_1468160 [compost metagenome]
MRAAAQALGIAVEAVCAAVALVELVRRARGAHAVTQCNVAHEAQIYGRATAWSPTATWPTCSLAQAHATPHAGWRATLLGWARKRRVAGRAVRVRRAQQLSLFSEGA